MPRSSKTLSGRTPKPVVEQRSVAALRRYKVTPEEIEKVGNITAMLQRAVGGRDKVIDILRFSQDTAATEFLKAYDEAPIGDRNYLSFEAICIKASIPTSAVYGAIIMSAKSIMGQESALTTIIEHPEVVRKTIQFAKELPGASKDREMIHQAVGYLPSKGGGISVNLFGGNPQPTESDDGDDDDTAFREAFPSINTQLEGWGANRRGLLEKGRP